MNRVIKKESIPVVQKVLDEIDLYHFTDFPWQASMQDVRGHNDKILRQAFTIGKYGIMSDLVSYKTSFQRAIEYSLYADYAQSLRQKLNIINEMLDCNFESYLPVHISVKPNFKGEQILDLYNINNYKNYRFIAHPGQTRCQASVFTKTPLKNVLLYIPKKYYKQCKLKESKNFKKINSIEELLQVYNPNKDINGTYQYDFYMPSMPDGLKRHDNIPILKCNQIKDSKGNSYHNSKYYVENSFISMRNFSEIFWNNKFIIYTTSLELTDKFQNKNRKELYNGTINLGHDLQLFENKRVQKGYSLNIDLSKPESPFLNLPYKEYQELKSYANYLKEPLNDDPDYQKQLLLPSNIEYVKIEDCDSFKDIVKKHNFKGFCIYFNCNKVKIFNRDFIELLYYINSTVALSSNKEKTIAILNCEHEYWKTGNNFKQWIIEETFYS